MSRKIFWLDEGALSVKPLIFVCVQEQSCAIGGLRREEGVDLVRAHRLL
jgi:hypothetical protein